MSKIEPYDCQDKFTNVHIKREELYKIEQSDELKHAFVYYMYI
jgi:hypothetical protein